MITIYYIKTNQGVRVFGEEQKMAGQFEVMTDKEFATLQNTIAQFDKVFILVEDENP